MSFALQFNAAFNLTPNARAPLAPWAARLHGKPYAARARGPDAFDCMGVIEWVQVQLQRPVRDYSVCYAESIIGDGAAIDALLRAEAHAWEAVEAGDVGDVLVCGSGRKAHHVAVLCGDGHAVHCTKSGGVQVLPIVGRRRVSRFDDIRIYGVARPR